MRGAAFAARTARRRAWARSLSCSSSVRAPSPRATSAFIACARARRQTGCRGLSARPCKAPAVSLPVPVRYPLTQLPRSPRVRACACGLLRHSRSGGARGAPGDGPGKGGGESAAALARLARARAARNRPGNRGGGGGGVRWESARRARRARRAPGPGRATTWRSCSSCMSLPPCGGRGFRPASAGAGARGGRSGSAGGVEARAGRWCAGADAAGGLKLEDEERQRSGRGQGKMQSCACQCV